MRIIETDYANTDSYPVYAALPPIRIVLPQETLAVKADTFEDEILGRFLRHLRQVPSSRMEIKILSAIQFTADIMDHGDALVAKILADKGLRAPRRAFPVAFLDFADKAVARRSWDYTSFAPSSVMALHEHWRRIGEGDFTAGMADSYAVYNRGSYANA